MCACIPKILTFFKWLPFLAVIFHLLYPSYLDWVTKCIYGRISMWKWGTSSLFEPFVAVYSFGLWIVYFDIIIDSVSQFRKYKFFPSETRCKSLQSFWSPTVYILGVRILQLVFGTNFYGGDRISDLTFWRVLVEVLLGLFLYDFLFFFVHRGYHAFKFLRGVHTQHHERQKQCSRDTVNHGLIDGSMQVLVNIVVQQVTPFGGFGMKHPFSRVLHNIFVTYLICEAHSGYDCPWFTHNLFPWVFGGSRSHEKHHHHYNCCFQQYLKYFEYFDPEEYHEIKFRGIHHHVKDEMENTTRERMEWSNKSKILDYLIVFLANQSVLFILCFDFFFL